MSRRAAFRDAVARAALRYIQAQYLADETATYADADLDVAESELDRAAEALVNELEPHP